jgi:hypothetical protein
MTSRSSERLKPLGDWTNESWREWTKAQAKLLHVCIYLIETRDERKKGNKLAPEKIAMDALQRHAESLRGSHDR